MKCLTDSANHVTQSLFYCLKSSNILHTLLTPTAVQYKCNLFIKTWAFVLTQCTTNCYKALSFFFQTARMETVPTQSSKDFCYFLAKKISSKLDVKVLFFFFLPVISINLSILLTHFFIQGCRRLLLWLLTKRGQPGQIAHAFLFQSEKTIVPRPKTKMHAQERVEWWVQYLFYLLHNTLRKHTFMCDLCSLLSLLVKNIFNMQHFVITQYLLV